MSDIIEFIRYNEEYVKEIPNKLIAELIAFPGVIPDSINNLLAENILIIKMKGIIFYSRIILNSSICYKMIGLTGDKWIKQSIK